jgi:hypothetical protein
MTFSQFSPQTMLGVLGILNVRVLDFSIVSVVLPVVSSWLFFAYWSRFHVVSLFVNIYCSNSHFPVTILGLHVL